MEGNDNEVFVAYGREEHVHYVKSYVIEEKHLRLASLLGKIVMQTKDPADPAIEELNKDDSVEEFVKGEFKCPFLQIGFMNLSRSNGESTKEEEEAGV